MLVSVPKVLVSGRLGVPVHLKVAGLARGRKVEVPCDGSTGGGDARTATPMAGAKRRLYEYHSLARVLCASPGQALVMMR